MTLVGVGLVATGWLLAPGVSDARTSPLVAGTGEISGVVTYPGGGPFEGATVSVSAGGSVVVPGATSGEVVTDADGAFLIGDLALVDFQVAVFPPADSGWAAEWFENKYYPASTTLVAAALPGEGAGLVIELDQVATVRGSVTDAAGVGLVGVDVFATVYLPGIGWIGDGPAATTGVGGSYVARIPPSGFYAICASRLEGGIYVETCNPAGFDFLSTPETDGVLATPGSDTIVNLQFGNPDQDGISDEIEDGAPNGGDGNNDGIADSAQPNVSSFVGRTGDYITLESPDGTTLQNVHPVDVADLVTPPPADLVLPEGLIAFEIDV